LHLGYSAEKNCTRNRLKCLVSILFFYILCGLRTVTGRRVFFGPNNRVLLQHDIGFQFYQFAWVAIKYLSFISYVLVPQLSPLTNFRRMMLPWLWIRKTRLYSILAAAKENSTAGHILVPRQLKAEELKNGDFAKLKIQKTKPSYCSYAQWVSQLKKTAAHCWKQAFWTSQRFKGRNECLAISQPSRHQIRDIYMQKVDSYSTEVFCPYALEAKSFVG